MARKKLIGKTLQHRETGTVGAVEAVSADGSLVRIGDRWFEADACENA